MAVPVRSRLRVRNRPSTSSTACSLLYEISLVSTVPQFAGRTATRPSLCTCLLYTSPSPRDRLFAPIESLASLGFGENRITNTDLSKPADPALKKVIVDPGYEFELVTTLFKNRPDVSIVTE